MFACGRWEEFLYIMGAIARRRSVRNNLFTLSPCPLSLSSVLVLCPCPLSLSSVLVPCPRPCPCPLPPPVSSPRLLRSTAAPFRLTAAPFRLTAAPSRSTATRRYLEPCPDPPVTVGFRCPPFPLPTRPCSAQDNTLSVNSTVLHFLALEGAAAGRGTQRGPTAIGFARSWPLFELNRRTLVRGSRCVGSRP